MSSLVPLKTVDEEDDAPPAFVATVSLDPLGLVESKSLSFPGPPTLTGKARRDTVLGGMMRTVHIGFCRRCS